MKSFALLLAVSLCGTFVPSINGLSCYKCSWSDSSCNSEKFVSSMPKEKCGSKSSTVAPNTNAPGAATTAAAGAGASSAAPGASDAPAAPPADAPPAARKNFMGDLQASDDVVYRAIRSKSFLSMTADPAYHCYRVNVKANDTSPVMVERGCKVTAKTDDCLTLDKTKYPKGSVDKCTTCSKDDCNAGLSLSSNAILIHFALLLATGIAKMFFQTK